MNRRTILALLAGIPIIGKALAAPFQQKAALATPPPEPFKASALDTFFFQEAARIENEIRERVTMAELPTYFPHSTTCFARAIISQRICLHDLVRSHNGPMQYQLACKALIAETADQCRGWTVGTVRVTWMNILNPDIKHPDFNPIGSWGRFHVYLQACQAPVNWRAAA